MKNKNVNVSSNRSFGIIFFFIFLIISIYPIIHNENLKIWSLIVSILFLFVSIFKSELLTPLNKIWIKFGLFLGKIISPIILSIIFFGLVTPIGILMRVFKKDLLNLKFNNDKTYWIEKKGPKSQMKNQF